MIVDRPLGRYRLGRTEYYRL